jgi:hypothetical protein
MTEGTREDCIHYLRERIAKELQNAHEDAEHWEMLKNKATTDKEVDRCLLLEQFCKGKRDGLRTALIFVSTVQDAINGHYELDVPHE